MIAALGPLLPQALKAWELLKDAGIESLVVNPSCVNHPDIKTLAQLVSKAQGCLLTVEEHLLSGGLGSILSHRLCLEGVAPRVKSLALEDGFGRSAYSADELYAHYNLDALSLVDAAKELVNSKV